MATANPIHGHPDADRAKHKSRKKYHCESHHSFAQNCFFDPDRMDVGEHSDGPDALFSGCSKLRLIAS